MSIKSIETTFTVFCTFANLDKIVPDISSTIPDFFERTSFMEVSATGMQYQAYSFRDKKRTLVLRPGRVDFAYNTFLSDQEALSDFLKYLNAINFVHALQITRLALNSSSYIDDNDFDLLKKLVSNINLHKYNIKNEFLIRFNSIENLYDTEINNITVLQSGILTDNNTFKKVNAIIINKDINTSTTSKIYKFTSLEKTIEHFSLIMVI